MNICLLVYFFLSFNLLSSEIMILLSSLWQKQLGFCFFFPLTSKYKKDLIAVHSV